MKKIFFILLALLSISCSNKPSYESLIMLGTDNFTRDRWAKSDEAARGKMIYDFIKRNDPITNKNRKFIVDQLGESTGYHDYDSYPAYYVGPKPLNSDAKAYLVAFVIDHITGNVTRIHIEPELK